MLRLYVLKLSVRQLGLFQFLLSQNYNAGNPVLQPSLMQPAKAQSVLFVKTPFILSPYNCGNRSTLGPGKARNENTTNKP